MEVSKSSLNDGTAEQYLTVPKGCCYCSYNRFWLFVLALFKLVLSLGLLIVLSYTVVLCFIFGRPQSLYHVVLLYIAVFFDIIDIIFGLVTVISLCVKYKEIMEMYYTYSIYIFGSITVLCCIAFYILLKHVGGAILIIFCLFFLFLSVSKSDDEERSSDAEEKRTVPVIIDSPSVHILMDS